MNLQLRPQLYNITLNLTELVKTAKSKIDLEFWQWVWKAKYIHLG